MARLLGEKGIVSGGICLLKIYRWRDTAIASSILRGDLASGALRSAPKRPGDIDTFLKAVKASTAGSG
jgi:hypothetical protein